MLVLCGMGTLSFSAVTCMFSLAALQSQVALEDRHILINHRISSDYFG